MPALGARTDRSVLRPSTHERGLAENPYADLAFVLPVQGGSRVLERRLVANQQYRPTTWTQDPVTLAQETLIERADVLGTAQLLTKRWIAHNAVDAAVRQRQRPRIPARQQH